MKERAKKGDKQAQKDLAPLKTPANVIVWEAFRLLNLSRDRIFEGISGLKISEMVTTLTVLGVKDEKQLSRMIRHLVSMDGIYKDWKAKNER